MYRLFITLSAATVVASAALVAETPRTVAEYSFLVTNAPTDVFSPDGRMRVRLMRWSSDAERKQLMAALEIPSNPLAAFPYVDVVGYVRWPGGLEHSVRYARQTPRADGGADVVMVVERPLWLWWDSTEKWAADQQFTVIHIRLNKDGRGEGRIATGSGFTRDSDSGVVIADLTKPALLTDVRRESVK